MDSASYVSLTPISIFIATMVMTFGCVFLYSGLSKAVTFSSFEAGLEDYQLFPLFLNKLIAAGIITVELLIAAAHIFWWKISLISSLGMFFIVVLFFVVVLTLHRGIEVKCMCFGSESGKELNKSNLIQLGVLFVWELLIFWSVGSTNSHLIENTLKPIELVLIFSTSLLITLLAILRIESGTLKNRPA